RVHDARDHVLAQRPFRWVIAGRRGLDDDGEPLSPTARVQPHGSGVSGAYPGCRASGALDLHRIQVAPTHDDHVLAATTDHYVTVRQVPLVTGIQPAVHVP